jgi:hypothetical protein
MVARRKPSPEPLVFVEPMQPTLMARLPEGPDWQYEIKFDGYRTILIVQDGKARAFTRRGLDWTDRYPYIVEEAASLPASSAIIDGEVVILDEFGLSDFGALRRAMTTKPKHLLFYAFDLLHLDGADLRRRPLSERRAMLADLLAGHVTPQTAIQISEPIEGEGAAVFAAAMQHGLEDGTGLTFRTLDHGGEYPDTMPQAILLTDAEGRSCTNLPAEVDGKIVRSAFFAIEGGADDVTMALREREPRED